MLEIQIVQTGETPVFRIGGPSEVSRLLTFIVQEAETDELVWVVGPQGMVLSQETGVLIEARPGTAEEMAELERDATASLGALTAEVSHIAYGITPSGFSQTFPVTGMAPPLTPGRRYRVLAAGPASVGAEEFVHEPAF